jgi:hypothetical protein
MSIDRLVDDRCVVDDDTVYFVPHLLTVRVTFQLY